MAKSPAAILYDSNGVELAVDDATALPANTRGYIGVGYDGTNTRFIRVDSSGYQVIVGAGTAGTPAGGVVSIQGVSGGQAIPVSGVRSSTSAVTSVTASTSSVQILAANTARLGASVHNDSNKVMYLKMGTAATSTSYTVGVQRDCHYEVPFGYTGVIHAAWSTGVSGDARVTEFT